MKRISLFLLLIGLLFIGSGSFLYKNPAIEKIENVSLQELNPDHTIINLSLVVKNPNCFKIGVKTMEVRILDKDKDKLAKVVLQKAIEIEKRSSRTVEFQAVLDTRRVAKLVSYTTQNVLFNIQADARVKVLGVSKNISFEVPYEFDLRTALQNALQKFTATTQTITAGTSVKKGTGNQSGQEIFKVIKASLNEIGFTEFQFSIKFLLLNPYGFTFTFVDFPCEVFINDKSAGKGYLTKPLNFNEKVFSQEGELVFKMSHFQSIAGLSKGVLSGEIAYKVNGDAVLNGFGMEIRKPFQFQGKTNINPLKSKDSSKSN